MSNHSIRFFNALAAALFDRCIIDDYDFNFERFGRPFTTTANNNGMVVTLINVDSANVFVKYLSDVIPTQFSSCVAMTNGLVLSLEQDETLSQMFMDTEAVFTDAKNRKYDFPYILSICCGQGRYTACLVCTRSSAWQELLDDIVDDATYLVDRYKLPLPHGYLPAHITATGYTDGPAHASTAADDITAMVNDVLLDVETPTQGTITYNLSDMYNKPTKETIADWINSALASDVDSIHISGLRALRKTPDSVATPAFPQPLTNDVYNVMTNAVSANLDDLSTEQMMQVTMDAMSNVATRNSQQKPIRAYGESEIRDEAARRDIDFAGLGIIDESNLNIASFNGISSFGSEPALSNAPTATLMGIYTADAEQLDNPQVVIDAEGNRAFAEVTPAEDFEAYEPYTADAEDFEQLADTASELTPEDTIHVLTQTVALITGEGVTANVYNQIRGFLESCRDRWVKSEPSLLRALVTDFYGTMDNTDAHGIHTGDFVVFNKAEPTETLRSGYHLDLRGIDSLGVYRCTLADTDMRTEWFVAKITPENYIDVMRVMFPRQYSGITIKYVQDFFESLLNEPTQPVEDFTLDNGYYDVRMLAQIDNLDIWLLARVECNFPVVQVAEPATDDAPAA